MVDCDAALKIPAPDIPETVVESCDALIVEDSKTRDAYRKVANQMDELLQCLNRWHELTRPK